MKIDKNVPIPNNRKYYPLKDMLIGDSFFVATKNEIEKTNARSAAASAGIRHGRKYVSRSVKGGIRIWRTE